MNVVRLSVCVVRIPLRRPIRHASHSRDSTDNVVVRAELADGSVGFGEGVPREYVTGETAEGAMDLIAATAVTPSLPDRFDEAVAAVSALSPPPQAADDRGIRGNAARCALELALLDAVCRSHRRPLSAVIQLVAPDMFEPRDEVRYSGAITSAKGWKLRLSALAQRLYGMRQMKVKVGIEGYDDVKRLRTIRACVGAAMDLRIDANEAWSPAHVAARIEELSPFGITAVEQPVRHEDVACLAEVRKRVKVPVMLDESLCGEIDGRRAVEDATCDLFNLRLSKCGGLLPTLRLARLAKMNGLGCQLGCQVGETAILSAAGRHFAASVGGLRYLEGSYDKRLVREALGAKDITFGLGGRAPALRGAGLGVEIDEERLKAVTLKWAELR